MREISSKQHSMVSQYNINFVVAEPRKLNMLRVVLAVCLGGSLALMALHVHLRAQENSLQLRGSHMDISHTVG